MTKTPNRDTIPVSPDPYRMEEAVMKELVKAVRHDTLGAIDNGEKLIRALGSESGKGTETLRKSTERLVRHLKEELTRWESEYHKARAS